MSEDTAEAWRRRATQARKLAQSMKHPEVKREMELIACAYERLAQHASKRHSAKE